MYVGRFGSRKISSKEKSIDCSNLLLIPGFINSHTHIADSVGKDLSIDADVDSKIQSCERTTTSYKSGKGKQYIQRDNGNMVIKTCN